MKTKISLLLFILIAFSCSEQKKEPAKTDFTQFVDPLIGSGYHGHVFVGANVPFGAVQLGPNNETQGWDWCSGYHYSDSVLVGFAHTHLSGTGIGDLGDIVFMPVSGDFNPEENKDVPYRWKSEYSHDNEKAEAGYYSLHIDRYNIDAELTASERVGFHRYKYNEGSGQGLIIDLKYGTGWDLLTKGNIEQVGKSAVQGFRFSKGWAPNQQIFFYAEFSKEIKKFEVIAQDEKTGVNTILIQFEGDSALMAKTGISPVSEEGAKNNLNSEIGLWNFDGAKQKAHDKWNTELGKIKIETESLADKKTFYTALYHTMIAPSLFNDANGDYRGAEPERKVHQSPGHDTYTTFSLWDTYRAAHPLYLH